MAVGAKLNETRGRRTHIRGDIIICSAKKRDVTVPLEIQDWLCDHVQLFNMARSWEECWNDLPFGKALCVVKLYDCVPTSFYHGAVPLKISHQEAIMGDYTPGRFAWLTGNLRRFKEPFPVKGHQGWFDIPDALVMAALHK